MSETEMAMRVDVTPIADPFREVRRPAAPRALELALDAS